LAEDEDVEDLAKEMFYLWKNDEEELGKRLDRISYAKGGEVKKKGDNSMLIGGLAGILLGIFLGRK